jgi:hypothetical protein
MPQETKQKFEANPTAGDRYAHGALVSVTDGADAADTEERLSTRPLTIAATSP